MDQMDLFFFSEIYYMHEIQDLTTYARARGVLLLPELDAPAHATYGWDWGPDEGRGNLTTCQVDNWILNDTRMALRNVKLAAEPPAGQLNPLNANVYQVLGELYKDLLDSFTTKTHTKLPLFHMGGDEVNLECWARDPDIGKWMEANDFKTQFSENRDGYIQLWNEFQEKAHGKLKEAYKSKKLALDGAILWTSELTKPFNLHK